MNVTVVTSQGCSHCSHVLKQIEELKPEFPSMTVETVGIASDAGQKLVAEHGILSSPGVLIDGVLAFYGPRSTEELRHVLSEHRA